MLPTVLTHVRDAATIVVAAVCVFSCKLQFKTFNDGERDRLLSLSLPLHSTFFNRVPTIETVEEGNEVETEVVKEVEEQVEEARRGRG